MIPHQRTYGIDSIPLMVLNLKIPGIGRDTIRTNVSMVPTLERKLETMVHPLNGDPKPGMRTELRSDQ